MFEVNNKNTRYLSGVFNVNFEHLIAGRPHITLDCFTYASDYSIAPQFCTVLKMKVFFKEVNVNKSEKKRICSHLLKKSLNENFIFCTALARQILI